MNHQDQLIELATPRQQEYLDAMTKYNNDRHKAAKSLKVSPATIKRSLQYLNNGASRKGHAPGHFNSGVAPGYAMGKVTVQRDRQGEVERTWERQSPDGQMREQALRDFAATLGEGFTKLAPIVKAPSHSNKDIMCVYPMGDPHFGMYAWAEDAGDDFDLDIAEALTKGAIDTLVGLAPAAETGVLLNLGDMFHADSQNNTTTKGTRVDVDGRRPKVQQVGLMAIVHGILRLLEKHPKVIYRGNRGNHDEDSSYTLSLMLSCWFRNEPRVTIDLSPAVMWYYRFGSNLLASTHGDTIKGKDMIGVMAADRPKDWGLTKHRHCLVGHVHHSDLKEYRGGRVEYFNTLAARDAWHQGQGYRAGRDMRLIVYHTEHGEVARHRCDIGMLAS